MYKCLGPVQVRCSKCPLSLLHMNTVHLPSHAAAGPAWPACWAGCWGWSQATGRPWQQTANTACQMRMNTDAYSYSAHYCPPHLVINMLRTQSEQGWKSVTSHSVFRFSFTMNLWQMCTSTEIAMLWECVVSKKHTCAALKMTLISIQARKRSK